MLLTEQEIKEAVGFTTDQMIAYRRIESAVMERLETLVPVAWQTFDGEGGYDYRSYIDNENYREEFLARNPNPIYKDWVKALYLHPIPADDIVRDVERYRWLRNSGKGDNLIRYDCRGVYLPESSALDAAIDAAIDAARNKND